MKVFLQRCRDAIGDAFVLTQEAELAASETDFRGRFRGKALALLRPGTTEEVAVLVRLCVEYGVPVVPQGGNTGLVLGSVPDQSGRAVILSLTRLNRIRALDPRNNTITVEAGCVLAQVHNAASTADRLFPLSLASEGSCTLGGNLSTNAGGTAVLRYGNARQLCLGLEVVTAQGEIWDGLRGLRKDNTGYDLRDLFIGAEGTLGIITAAVMQLFPLPQAQLTAIAAVASPAAALELLTHMQNALGPTLTAFELMSDFCLDLVQRHFPHLNKPFKATAPYYVLLELSDHQETKHAALLLESALTTALQHGLAVDVALAASIAQAQTMWQMREHISMAQAAEGKNVKHDISLPLSAIPEFIETAGTCLQSAFPACRVVCFGHMGDGNLHYNVSPPEGQSDRAFLAHQPALNRIVHDLVHERNGSISAEHGLGALKRDEIRLYKSELELRLMRSIKEAFDPRNLMNPGKLI